MSPRHRRYQDAVVGQVTRNIRHRKGKHAQQKALSDSPERTCVGCRTADDPRAMVRFVKDLDGILQVDINQRCSGRGAYLHAMERCLAKALKKRALERALDAALRPEDRETLLVRIVSAVTSRFVQRLGLARRAGATVIGIEPVRRAMEGDGVALLFIASDASESTHKQITQNAKRKGLTVMSCLDGSQLAKAVGMDYLSVVGITKEPFSTDLGILWTPLAETEENSTRFA